MKHAVTCVLIGALAVPAAALADDQLGTLLEGASNVDLYRVTCSDAGTGPTSYLELRVRDEAAINANAVISAQVLRGVLALNTTDNGPDGDTRFSPWIRAHGGDGGYQVLVTKSRAARDDYRLQFHCTTATGRHSATMIVQLQNR